MKTKKNNWLIVFLKVSIVLFLILYIMLENGYYETKLSKKVTLTEENIRKFEDDVKNNKIVDISNYNVEEEKDYSNKMSRLGQKINDSFGKIIIKGAKEIVDILKSLFW